MKAFAFPKKRALAYLAVCYGLGVCLGRQTGQILWIVGGGLIGSLLLYLLGLRKHHGRLPWICLIMLVLGGVLTFFAAHPTFPPAGTYTVQGIVSGEVAYRDGRSTAAYLRDVQLADADGTTYAVSKVYWTHWPEDGAAPLQDGQQVTFQGTAYIPSGQTNPYGFDFQAYLLQKGVSLGISGSKNMTVGEGFYPSFAGAMLRARLFLADKMQQIFGDQSALPEALLLGMRAELPLEVQDSFAKAGIAHILAVSGLHVGLIVAALMLALRPFSLSPRARMGVVGVFLLLYCALLNFSAPVLRATIFIMIQLEGRCRRRARDMLTTLSAAFILILLLRPLDLFTASFQLSFGAVMGIALLSHGLRRLLRKVRPYWLRSGWVTSLAATAGVILPSIQVFNTFSLVGLLINPLICGLMTVLLPAYIVVLLIGCVWLSAGQIIAIPINAVTAGLTAAIRWIGALPFAQIAVPNIPLPLLLAILFCLILCTRFVFLHKKQRLWLGFCALAVAAGCWQATVCRDVQYIQFSMGQADSAMIIDGDQTILIDTGEYGGDVANYLRATGRRLDTLVLTHLHADHSLGLAQLIATGIPIGQVWIAQDAMRHPVSSQVLALLDQLKQQDVPIYEVSAGDTLATARTRLQVLWPEDGKVMADTDANLFPLVLLCELDGVRLLATGDLGSTYELYSAVPTDILKVAHHGSKNSSSEAYLTALQPRLAIISCSGYNEVLPHPDTLERLAAVNAQVYKTSDTGALTLQFRAGSYVVIPFLKENP